jgi:hypothetical protein
MGLGVVVAVVEVVGVWLRVMKRENMGLCNGRRRERCPGSVMAES